MLTNPENIYYKVKELDEIKNELIKDANLHKKIDVIDDDVSRAYARQYIRASFSVIEAVFFATKQVAREIASDLRVIDDGAKAVLNEIKFDVSENGVVREKRFDINIKSNTVFTFEYMYKISGIEYKFDRGCQEWRDFSASVEIRNRIIHPKKMSDIMIDVADFVKARDSIKWWIDKHFEMMRAVATEFETKSKLSA